MLKEAVIISAVRTPIGKYKGMLSDVEAYKLGSIVIKEAVKRSKINVEEIDDVIMGNLLALPGNVSRVAMLDAGLPESIPAMTIDRQCASGLEAINIAALNIMTGRGSIYIVGGTENMTMAPYFMEKPKRAYDLSPPKFLSSRLGPDNNNPTMLETAINVSEKYSHTREDLDKFAFESQMKAKKAIEENKFKDEIVPVEISIKRKSVIMEQDESPRFNTTLEGLNSLPSLVKKDSIITAGNSCPMNDGASALVIMEKEKAEKLGLKWFAKVKYFTTVGLSPQYMGMGPYYAVKKLTEKYNFELDNVDLIELNEAFATQSIECIKKLELDKNKVNVNGGAIALGHPLGATGAILTTKLIHEMKRENKKLGLVTMCIGGGQGSATLFER